LIISRFESFSNGIGLSSSPNGGTPLFTKGPRPFFHVGQVFFAHDLLHVLENQPLFQPDVIVQALAYLAQEPSQILACVDLTLELEDDVPEPGVIIQHLQDVFILTGRNEPGVDGQQHLFLFSKVWTGLCLPEAEEVFSNLLQRWYSLFALDAPADLLSLDQGRQVIAGQAL
jgi:hypothetical protein